jgi:hypothetical protein
MSWSDYGDWTSADTLRLNPYLKSGEEIGGCVEALMRAVQERSDVTNRPTGFVDSNGNITRRLGNLFNICDDLHTQINAIIPLFVNHHDHDGDWHGVPVSADLAPAWTEAALLAQIGATERITAPERLGELLPWLFQQKLILSQLRWRKTEAMGGDGAANVFDRSGDGEVLVNSKDFGYGYQWPDLATAVAAAESVGTWPVATSTGIDEAWAGAIQSTRFYQIYNNQEANFYATRYAVSVMLSFPWVARDISVSIDHYAMLRQEGSYNTQNPAAEIGFPPGDMIIKTGSCTKILDGSDVELFAISDFPSIENIPFWPPETETQRTSWRWDRVDLDDYRLRLDTIIKFDGPNGFEFLD